MEHKPSKFAIGAMVAGVAAYDIACPEGETISEGFDRLIEKYPKSTYLAIGMTALHLMNILPPPVDPLHQLTRIKSLRKDRE